MIASSNSVTATTIGTSSSSSSTAITTTSRNSGGSNYKGSSSSVHRNTIEVNEENRNGPYFDKASSKNITALLGKTAYLNCRVKNLGNKTMLLQVSWVRHRDIHLLTVGRYTYTSDQRFRAIHQPQTEDWILQIKYPQHRDSGIYECQVSTTPHMSHYIHLNVVEPSTQIIGAPDLYIESGSTINLTCVILNSPEPPAYIFWNHNSAIINYDSPRGGVSVVTNKGETTTSFLLIKSARPSDSGQYQCNPSNSKSKGVTVHVLNGVSHSVSRGIPSSNAARGTSTSSNVSKSLSISLPINIFICYSIYQTVSENTECCQSHLTQTINNIIKAIIFCVTALLIKCLNLFSKYTHRTTMIIEFQSPQQYSNHDRFKKNASIVDLKSNQHHANHYKSHHSHPHQTDIYHIQYWESTKLNCLIQNNFNNNISNNNDKQIKMQRLDEEKLKKTIANDHISESTLIITFSRKIYTQESDVR
ncbi:uncharacterized protein LOC129913494 isoform X2 [Episyrphus balteatus]|nr:uncharacterized protein LOC129913494 isoform X2 [Episyrphus balteatus]XP_055848184.1 uncharacterized protein LOC129913494 isoform X2 [Episyrphus balteatus]